MLSSRRKRQKRSDAGEASELPMTPMIDIVFQLLIYFLYIMKDPVPIYTHLDVLAPSPDRQAQQSEMPPVLQIEVFADGYRLNERPLSYEKLSEALGILAEADRNQTVVIMATMLSEHYRLVDVLDLCAVHGMNNLSIISTN